MSNLVDLTIAEARDGLRAKTFSALELTTAYLARLDQQRGLNAFITETPERALSDAKASDVRLAKGEGRAMEGIPIGNKDLLCTEGVLTTAASHILHGFIPPYESTVSGNLKNAGTVMLGKTNLDEFAMGSSTTSSYYGPVKNPWKHSHVPGGSSGGSAAAVSARLVLGATGTDTGGSIRQPASYCGITGIKPTYGRCSRWGIIAYASSLDQAGPMTRTVRDAAIMLGSMAGFDGKDSTSANLAVPDFEALLGRSLKGVKVGLPKEYRPDGLNAEVAALWDQGVQWLTEAGAEVVEVSLPHTRYALAAYYVIAPAEASSNLARYDGVRFGLRVAGETLDQLYYKTRAAGFGAEVRRRILTGTYVLSAGYYDAYYLKAQRVRALIIRDFEEAFKTVDVLLTPTAPTAAFDMSKKSDDPVAQYLDDVFTVPTSLAGLPGLSVPGGVSTEGLPLGLQVIGRPFEEAIVLQVGEALERAAQFSTLPPL